MEWLYRYAAWAQSTTRKHSFVFMVLVAVASIAAFHLPYAWLVALVVLALLIPIGDWLDRRRVGSS